jgi:hypothetical protein
MKQRERMIKGVCYTSELLYTPLKIKDSLVAHGGVSAIPKSFFSHAQIRECGKRAESAVSGTLTQTKLAGKFLAALLTVSHDSHV